MGILEFVFGKGTPKDDTAPKESFYLNDDDAKTFGNIDYMRSNKVVRRTFAKKKGQAEHLESVRQISALGAKSVDGTGSFSASSSADTFNTPSTPTSESSSVPKSTRRKPASSDMDMFRNMAKDMRK
ncbi:MAG: hypothetical protein WA783_10450 [Phormidesmis sp.]